MNEKLRVSLRKVEAYEKIINVIDSSKTENHYKVCYAMIGLFDGLFQDNSLTEQLTDIANIKYYEDNVTILDCGSIVNKHKN